MFDINKHGAMFESIKALNRRVYWEDYIKNHPNKKILEEFSDEVIERALEQMGVKWTNIITSSKEPLEHKDVIWTNKITYCKN
jgi:hypothetical protein